MLGFCPIFLGGAAATGVALFYLLRPEGKKEKNIDSVKSVRQVHASKDFERITYGFQHRTVVILMCL